MTHAKLSPTRRIVHTLARAWTFAGYSLQVLLPRLPRLGRSATRCLLDEKIDGLRLRILPALPNAKSFEDDFAQLISSIHDVSAFQTLHWIRPLLDYSERLSRLRLICGYDKGRLIGVLPLEQFWNGTFTIPGGMMSDYLDPPINPVYTTRFWSAALRALRQHRDPCGVSLELSNLSEDGGDRLALGGCAVAEGYSLLEEPFDISARITLRASWDEQLAGLKAHDRKETRRKLKRAVEQGGATLKIVDTPEQIDLAIDQTLHLMRLGGGGKARKAKWVYPVHFKACAQPLAREGRLRVYQLQISNQLAASLIALPQKSCEILWCGAFDEQFSAFSPGITLFSMIMQNAISRNVPALDLLRGKHEYKYRLGAVDHPLYRVMLTR